MWLIMEFREDEKGNVSCVVLCQDRVLCWIGGWPGEIWRRGLK